MVANLILLSPSPHFSLTIGLLVFRSCSFGHVFCGVRLFSESAWRESPVLVSSSGSLGISLPLLVPVYPFSPGLRVRDLFTPCLSLLPPLQPLLAGFFFPGGDLRHATLASSSRKTLSVIFNAHKCKAPSFMPVKNYSVSFRAVEA